MSTTQLNPSSPEPIVVAFVRFRAPRGGRKRKHRGPVADTLAVGASASRARTLDTQLVAYDPSDGALRSYAAAADPATLSVRFGPRPVACVDAAALVAGRAGDARGVRARLARALVEAAGSAEPGPGPPPVPRVVAAFRSAPDVAPPVPAFGAPLRGALAARGAAPDDVDVAQEILVDALLDLNSTAEDLYLPADYLVDDEGAAPPENRPEQLFLDLRPTMGAVLPNPFYARSGRLRDVPQHADQAARDGASNEAIAAALADPSAPLVADRRIGIHAVARRLLVEGFAVGRLSVRVVASAAAAPPAMPAYLPARA